MLMSGSDIFESILGFPRVPNNELHALVHEMMILEKEINDRKEKIEAFMKMNGWKKMFESLDGISFSHPDRPYTILVSTPASTFAIKAIHKVTLARYIHHDSDKEMMIKFNDGFQKMVKTMDRRVVKTYLEPLKEIYADLEKLKDPRLEKSMYTIRHMMASMERDGNEGN